MARYDALTTRLYDTLCSFTYVLASRAVVSQSQLLLHLHALPQTRLRAE